MSEAREGVPYRSIGLSPVWSLVCMPDGTYAEGMGATWKDAEADARRRWKHRKRAYAGPLAVNGREYQRRLRARRRRARR